MDTLIESMGLLCLAVQNAKTQDIGRTKIQKMIYFADRYLGWDVGDYRMHYYGPYSRNVAATLKTVRDGLVDEKRQDAGYRYELTQDGVQFVEDFAKHTGDADRVRNTKEVFAGLSAWPRTDLELATTIDYVQKTPGVKPEVLLERIHSIKDHFSMEQIAKAHKRLVEWKKKNVPQT